MLCDASKNNQYAKHCHTLQRFSLYAHIVYQTLRRKSLNASCWACAQKTLDSTL